MSFAESSHVLDTSMKIMEEASVCDHCLGRQFAWLGTGTTNQQRGQSIKLALLMTAHEMLKTGNGETGRKMISTLASKGLYKPAQRLAEEEGIEAPSQEQCEFCSVNGNSVFEEIHDLSERILGLSQKFEFDTFLVGSVPPPALVEKQDELNARLSLMHAETLKSHFNRELGRVLSARLGRDVDFDRPDVVFIIDMEKNEVVVQINPVFVYGRYRKLKRGIPQSRWDCSACRGRGCDECGGTGRRYQDSISEYIGEPSQKLLQGSRFKVHAAGREDVDVLMLGEGRPFVVEVSEPKIRKPNLADLRKKINKHAKKKVEVSELLLTDRERLQHLKSDSSQNIKEYHALIEAEREITEAELRAVELKFRDTKIEQRTPQRVAHRRSDLVREKRVIELKIRRRRDKTLEAQLRVQGGTYIKELISGDDGRTNPSISGVLGIPCRCVELNVTAIYADEPP